MKEPEKRLDVIIPYEDANSSKVRGLIEEFERVGKLTEVARARSGEVYAVFAVVSATNPVTETDAQQLKDLGAKVSLTGPGQL